MVQNVFEIKNESGLHTRPGNKFVKTAKGFDCNITIKKAEKLVNGKSLLKLMKANIIKGDHITLSCDGSDEVTALKELIECLESLED